MNGGHGQRNGTTLRLLTNPYSAWNTAMDGFKFGNTVDNSLEFCKRVSFVLDRVFAEVDSQGDGKDL
ncbi:hypothetical protein TNCV_4325881 [Trichonephila clavipes]|nr:hypothetical protein TNCV_4325881 [Trichonephila clavipes]